MKDIYEKDSLEIGIDEAGRGCLLGPVFVAGVIYNPEGEYSYEIRDSKKCPLKQRDILYDEIVSQSIAISIKMMNEKEIDQINILQATFKGMHRCIDEIVTDIKVDRLLVDGSLFPYYTDKETFEPIEHQCIVNGDNTYRSIAAASILAKVSRDRYIERLVKENNELEKYDLLKNKGYGTKNHMNAIKEYGITEYHRKSFGPCKININ
jgi:ribonuclease HII